MNRSYIHGYDPQENIRLQDQATTMFALFTGILVSLFWPMAILWADEPDEPQHGDARPAFSIDFSVERVGRARIAGAGASLAFTEYSAGLNWQFLLLDIDHRESSWRGGTGIDDTPDHEPLRSLTRVAPGLQYYGEFADRWGLWLKIITIAGFEDRISSRSWTCNPQIIGFHTPREQFTLYAGIGTLYHPVDSTLYPVLGVAWNKDARGGLSGALGFPETMLRFRFNEHLAVKADFQWDIRLYRLADDNPLAPGGYARVEELKPGLHLEYFPTAWLQVTTGIRRFVSRSLTFFSRAESKLADHDIKDAWSFVLEMDYKF